tara:strand:- start:2 stop:421 length:420 start_codon:yes stop_codon:yes gene_type:complete
MIRIRKIIYITILVNVVVQCISINTYAVDPEEFLQDPQLELRARTISKNIRCMICQNQSIDESASPLAKDLRILVRNKLTEGLTDKEIYKFLTDRYGDFILLKPPLIKNTYALWYFPFIIFILGIIVFYWYYKKSNYDK